MIYLIDLFCGGGGTSTGAAFAENVEVIYCVNHDPLAIKSHAANHPDCIHKTEDILLLDLNELSLLVNSIKQRNPEAIIGLWASLECTNFSNAKGGQPRDADSRTLAHGLFRYVEQLPLDIIYIENVIEFMAWGPLNESGKPVSRRKGTDYISWVKKMKSFGFQFDWRYLNAADYGAYTSRKRYFAQFVARDYKIVWPEITHSKCGELGASKYKAVREVLDLNDEGMSIFDRKKPLAERTLKRIYDGLIKFVAGGKDNFLAAYYGSGSNVSTTDLPAPTLTTKDRLSVIQCNFIDMQYGNGSAASIDCPAGSVTTSPKHSLITCKPWVMDTAFSNIGSDIDEPFKVITANRKWHYLMNPQFNSNGGSVDQPCFTLIARMDKMPPYLVVAESGKISIRVYEADSHFTVLIKEFMALYGIIDIKMRMLKILELKQIQGFPADYVLHGTKADQKKFIGNAVEVNQAKVILECSAKKNINQLKIAI